MCHKSNKHSNHRITGTSPNLSRTGWGRGGEIESGAYIWGGAPLPQEKASSFPSTAWLWRGRRSAPIRSERSSGGGTRETPPTISSLPDLSPADDGGERQRRFLLSPAPGSRLASSRLPITVSRGCSARSPRPPSPFSPRDVIHGMVVEAQPPTAPCAFPAPDFCLPRPQLAQI